MGVQMGLRCQIESRGKCPRSLKSWERGWEVGGKCVKQNKVESERCEMRNVNAENVSNLGRKSR